MSNTNKESLEIIGALCALGRHLIRTEGWHFSGKDLLNKVITAAQRGQWATAYERAALFDVVIPECPDGVTWDLTTPCLDALDQGAAGRATPEDRGAYYSTFNAAIQARA